MYLFSEGLQVSFYFILHLGGLKLQARRACYVSKWVVSYAKGSVGVRILLTGNWGVEG